jgi:hypothetical protein
LASAIAPRHIEGTAEYVRGDDAFAQACIETGGFSAGEGRDQFAEFALRSASRRSRIDLMVVVPGCARDRPDRSFPHGGGDRRGVVRGVGDEDLILVTD